MENIKKAKDIKKEIWNIYQIKVPEEKNRQNREEAILKEIVTCELMKDINPLM